uniref:Uncharacterized protein n=1 Tax=Rhizophora mucronata TaxID=61149 RepID=A0A2P2PRB2_RHIMU
MLTGVLKLFDWSHTCSFYNAIQYA